MDAIELLHIFSMKKKKTINCIGILGHSWCCCKALGKSNKIEFISHFLELRCGRYYFLMKFAIHSKKNANFGFGRKN